MIKETKSIFLFSLTIKARFLRMPVAKPQTDSEFTKFLLNIGTTPCIVDFFATWCGPCNAIAPTFEELSNKYLNLKFVKVDVDKCKETKNTYGVNAMPTFVVLLNGQRVDILRGANKTALENLAHKWSQNCPTQMISPIPGQSELSALINKLQCECLNEDDSNNLHNLLSGVGPLPVKVHSILLGGPKENAPKTVKIFANIINTLGFDRAQSTEPIQCIDMSEEKLVALKYVKFQNVFNLQLFVVDNVGGGDKTIIDEFRIYGTPIAKTTNMQEFARVAGKAGESDS
uniref:Thioredoxin-like protein n=1 Tax=Globodera rostochiensis TaxID=31243 RepID=A0A914GSW8_GLORO